MKVELTFRNDRARITAFYLARKLGKSRVNLNTERKVERFLARAIKAVVAEAVAEEARKDLRENHGLDV